MRSPALTATVSLVSAQTAEAAVESAAMVQVSAVAVGTVFMVVVTVVCVSSATVPLAPALPMLLPQLVGNALSVYAVVVAVLDETVYVPSKDEPASAPQRVPALYVPVMPEMVIESPAIKLEPEATVRVTKRLLRLKLRALRAVWLGVLPTDQPGPVAL